jgi:hypothetical protein
MADARSKGTHTDIQWLALFEACGSVCVGCHEQTRCEKDHIVPVYQGGSDGIDNLQPLCRACNAGKGPKSDDLRPENWRGRFEAILSQNSGKSNENNVHGGTPVASALNGRSTNQKPDTRDQKEDANASKARASKSDPEFEDWYSRYPHKVQRGAAEKAFKAARKLASLDELISGLHRYIGHKPEDRQWQNPATWLNGKGWLDEPAGLAIRNANWPPGRPPNGKRMNAVEAHLSRRAGEYEHSSRTIDYRDVELLPPDKPGLPSPVVDLGKAFSRPFGSGNR